MPGRLVIARCEVQDWRLVVAVNVLMLKVNVPSFHGWMMEIPLDSMRHVHSGWTEVDATGPCKLELQWIQWRPVGA